MIADLAAADGGQRLAVEYLDGHVVVWDLRRHSQLLSVPPGPTQHIWLTGDGRTLARDMGSIGSATNLLQIWPVGPRPAAQRPEAEFQVTTDWVWQEPQAPRMLIIPNFNAVEPLWPKSTHGGVPAIVLYDTLHHRIIASSSAPPGAPVNGFPQPPVIATDGVSYNRTTGTFVISSEAQMGFISWKPGSRPVPTRAHCTSGGTLSSDGRLFACVSGSPTPALSVWNVSQRRLASQWRPGGMATTNPYSVTFADGDRILAVAEGRYPPEPYVVQLYQVSDHRLLRTLQLGTAPNQYHAGQLWSVGQSLVAEQDPAKYGCGPQTGNQTCASRFFVFSLR
jgi:WD40 repeat protein